MTSDLYLHYKSQINEGLTPVEADHLIESAFNDYLKSRISWDEYGKIYFSCVAIINGSSCETAALKVGCT